MIRSRSVLESIEEGALAPYAVHSNRSRGRAYPEEEAPYRTAFMRDRDRILHTTAFRRLEYKTQVFVNYEGDYYRTRLTHTLEVCQIGRTLARALGLNEDLVEAIALAHDLGHPAFGHSGEETLAELMADHGGFNHNTQSLRIVEKLERRYPDFPGLNLTWEVREGIIKHETLYDRSDASAFEPDLRPPLEAQVVNVADETAYTAHDLDDGLRSGMIHFADLEGIALWEELLEQLGMRMRPATEMDRRRIIRRLIGIQVTDILQETTRRLKEAQISTLEDVRRYPAPLVGFSAEMEEKNRELKAFLFRNLYRHWRVVRMAVKARWFIRQLFQAYTSEPQLLPPDTRARLAEEDLYRVVCDYIAGMTDRYALEEYRKLFEPWERV
ncbi:MAG: deoxyguanosinetriphosphate triphosphohydrolase [Chloroflexia bacterium]